MRSHATRKTAAKTTTRPESAAVEYFRRKLEFDIGPYALKQILDTTPARVKVLDVRSAEAYAEAHIPTALSFPLADLAGRLATLPKDTTIVTYCGDITCPLSSRAAQELAQNGFTVQHLVGGIVEWSRKGYPVESAQPRQAEPPELTEQKQNGGPME